MAYIPYNSLEILKKAVKITSQLVIFRAYFFVPRTQNLRNKSRKSTNKHPGLSMSRCNMFSFVDLRLELNANFMQLARKSFSTYTQLQKKPILHFLWQSW